MTRIDEIYKLTKSLFPNGRAFWLSEETIQIFIRALCISEAEAYDESLSILSSILPDNDNFTPEDATLWERRLNIAVNPPLLTLDERKTLIARKYAFPGSFIYRQNWRYVEYQLQYAGFNVWVHENRFDDGFGGFEYINQLELSIIQHASDTELGSDLEMGDPGMDLIANLPDAIEVFDVGETTNFKGGFYIGGETFPDRAIVPKQLEKEFRKLVLTLKPTNTFAILLIDFYYTGPLEFMSGDSFEFMSGDLFELVTEP